jgi:argininosuccinate synthase
VSPSDRTSGGLSFEADPADVGRVQLLYALYDRKLSGFGQSGGEFSQDASPGFIELFTLQSRMAHRVRDRENAG